MIMIIWMSSRCLCVLFRPGLWPTNTGYCFVSVKRGDGATKGKGNQAKHCQGRERKGAVYKTKPYLSQTMPPFSIFNESVILGKIMTEECSLKE